MEKLIENQLNKGMLLKIDKDFLIKRYNESLMNICHKETKLKEFHIDSMGYSPEIAEEFNEFNYLNLGDINQKFILITLEQKNLPLLNTSFSNKKNLWLEFIEDNYEVLSNLTSKTSVFGEFQNNLIKIVNMEQLLNIKNIRIELDTPEKLFDKNQEFLELSDNYMEGDNCLNEELNERIIVLSKTLGNIFNKPITPKKLNYIMNSFYSSHFKGIYVFRSSTDFNKIIIIPKRELFHVDYNFKDLEVSVIKFKENKILDFLIDYDFVDIFNEDFYRKNIHLIIRKKDMVLKKYLTTLNSEISILDLTDKKIKEFLYNHYEDLPQTYKDLEKVHKFLTEDSYLDVNGLDIKTKFTLMRPKEELLSNENALTIIRHLIVNFDKIDFIRLFAFNKELFYKRYQNWLENYQSYVINEINENYVPKRKEIKNSL